MIIGKPMMKKETQQPKVKTGLCVRRYLGNSSEMDVTMVSMVANWNDAGEGTPEALPNPKGSEKALVFPTRPSGIYMRIGFGGYFPLMSLKDLAGVPPTRSARGI